MSDLPDIALIFVSYRTGPILFDAIRAALKCGGVNEIILVDNGNPTPAESTIDSAARIEARITVLRGHGNIGFAAGCNLGARDASASILVFVNPDVVLDRDAPRALAATLSTTAAPAIVGGDLRTPSGAPDRGSRRNRITLWNALAAFLRLADDIHMHDQPPPQGAVRVGAVSGALMAMRRDDFRTMGGFDEAYFLHMEDVDLCRRVEIAGGSVLFAPGPHGIHHRSSSEVSSVTIERYKAASFARYFRKFAGNPFERAAAEIAALALHVLMPMRARA